MLCKKCKHEMENAGYTNANSRDKISLVTFWKCLNCGFHNSSQHNIKKNQN